jgi:hypothetical protein
MDAKFLLVDWDAVSEPGLTEAVGVYEKGPYGNGIDAACTLAIEPHQEVHLPLPSPFSSPPGLSSLRFTASEVEAMGHATYTKRGAPTMAIVFDDEEQRWICYDVDKHADETWEEGIIKPLWRSEETDAATPFGLSWERGCYVYTSPIFEEEPSFDVVVFTEAMQAGRRCAIKERDEIESFFVSGHLGKFGERMIFGDEYATVPAVARHH